MNVTSSEPVAAEATRTDRRSERELVVTRVFDGPARLVFDAWTKPELLTRWFGIHNGWQYAVCEVDLRVGGAYRFEWRKPPSGVMVIHGVYREVSAPERLVFTFAWDTEGDLRTETVVTIGFADLGGKTEMTFVQTGFPTTADRDGHHEGWASSFDDLTGFIQRKDDR